ncbi:methionyl-tRNA formyltransferase [Dictyobacter aurantiacus]|uniref:methionyl-tRNA formyltransferase n=1 Tax=Dictyobacter aurantiacus TaxID=1936993 RepID=A0A401Z7W1_9CHLR|nr:methionyl-tRNA formyltransferase [Dictyobacter aurantiacus]GCE02932.1 formyl transferase [Dictyobacter aurantiacus]
MSGAFSPGMRILFFGMECDFSLPSFTALLQNGFEVCAVVIPADGDTLPGIHVAPAIVPKVAPRSRRGSLPMFTTATASLTQMAWAHAIPVWQVRELKDPETLATLAAYQPDILCVACFSRIIPRALLELPRLGGINVHPSLLPANRGPLPLFWTLRAGEEQTGVTIHRLTTALDSGPILAQETIAVPEGVRYGELEVLCAGVGARLLAQTVGALASGQCHARAQDEALSSYHPYPGDNDYVVNAREWGARRLYNFIRGVASVERPVEVLHGNGYLLAVDAVSYSLKGAVDIGDTVQQDGHGEATIICHDGCVRVYYI